MVPCQEAIVPALKCVGCGRLIMLPGRFPKGRPAMVRQLHKRGVRL